MAILREVNVNKLGLVLPRAVLWVTAPHGDLLGVLELASGHGGGLRGVGAVANSWPASR